MTELIARHGMVIFMDLNVSGLVKQYKKNPIQTISIIRMTKYVNILACPLMPTTEMKELLHRTIFKHIQLMNCNVKYGEVIVE